MVKVLVVEDSRVARELLVHLLGADPEIEVVGAVGDGVEALAFLRHTRPDVVTMDIVMPRMDGLETTREIMRTTPLPVVVVSSSWLPDEVNRTFLALEAGAVAVVDKPSGPGAPGGAAGADHLCRTVRLMAEVKVVGRRRPSPPVPSVADDDDGDIDRRAERSRLVAIGASTGGPPVIATILERLPAGYPLPILLVQHIGEGFIRGMADWLQSRTALRVTVPAHGDPARPGHAYLAPECRHLGVGVGGVIRLDDEPSEHGVRPSVSYLFRSVRAAVGGAAIAVLLTGMGRDGARELRDLRGEGAVTLAQDKGSSVVHGMPGEAIRLDGACRVLDPAGIARFLRSAGERISRRER